MNFCSKRANVTLDIGVARDDARRISCPLAQNFRSDFSKITRVSAEAKRHPQHPRRLLRDLSRPVREVRMNAVDSFASEQHAHGPRLLFNRDIRQKLDMLREPDRK